MGQSVCRALTADFTATRNIQGALATILIFEIFLVSFLERRQSEVRSPSVRSPPCPASRTAQRLKVA